MKSPHLADSTLMKSSLKQSFIKLDPRLLIKNPIMFVVEICTAVMLVETIRSFFNANASPSFAYNLTIFLILLVTVLFANFAEALAEARGKAQTDSLRKTREETPAKLILENGQLQTVPLSQLKKRRCVLLRSRGSDSYRWRNYRRTSKY